MLRRELLGRVRYVLTPLFLIHAKHGVALIGVRDPKSGAVELTPRDDAPIPPDWEVVYLGRDAVLKK